MKNITSKKQLDNVETILSDRMTWLPDSSMDAVLLYDTFHDLSEPDEVLEELHTKRELFKLVGKGKRTCNFSKELTSEKGSYNKVLVLGTS